MTNKLIPALLLLASGYAGNFVAAQTSPQGTTRAESGEALFAACGFCHGAQGQGRQRLDAPALAGMESWYVERQLHNFYDRARGTHREDLPGRQMALITGMLRNAATIKNVAAYIESLVPGAAPEARPDGVLLPLERPFHWDTPYAQLSAAEPGNAKRGQAIFQTACAACHGAQGQGNEMLGANKLRDLPGWYVARQVKYFRDGIRGANPGDSYGLQMAAGSKSLANEQAIADVVAFLDTL